MTNNRAEVRDFLVSRRAKITPDQAGVQYYGSNRRVPGLRREEVAMLAGLSVDYYTRVEKGSIRGVPTTVLRRDHRRPSARRGRARLPAGSGARRERQLTRPRRPTARHVSATVQRIIDGMPSSPAFVRNNRLDILATNTLARALYAPVFDSPSTFAASARTWPGSSFSTRRPRTSFPRPTCWPTSSSTFCAPRRAETPTTRRCPISWVSCRPEAINSGPAGQLRTCACIAQVQRGSTIPLWATWTSTSKPWTCQPTTVSSSPRTQPKLGHHPPTG